MADFARYLEHLRELPFVKDVRVSSDKTAHRGIELDGRLQLVTPTGPAAFLVEQRRSHLSQETVQRLLHIRTDLPNLLLLCPHVGRATAQQFRNAGLSFVDLEGNCFIRIGDRYLAQVEGRRSEHKPQSARALRAQSYRVLFALIAKPELTSATARVLAEAAGGVSPQTAIDTRARFAERGILHETSHGFAWAARGWKDALDLLVQGFTTTLAPRLALGRYRSLHRDLHTLEAALEQRLSAIREVEWRWGGGAASARLTEYFRGDQTVVYVTNAKLSLAKHLELRPDRDGPVRLHTSPGPVAFEASRDNAVHPLLAYLDLLAEGDERARDGASEIFRRYLAPIERARR